MLTLRCTTKVFKKFGIKPKSINVSDSTPTLGDWYVNTIDFLNNGDLLLACMHVESLYVMLLPLEPGMDATELTHAFRANLLARLAHLETPPQAAHKILSAYGKTTVFAKNADRKVAGHLNSALKDMDYQLENPRLELTNGPKLLLHRIEQWINNAPRGCSSQTAIWPLREFWASLHRRYPELPPRTTLTMDYAIPWEEDQAVELLLRHLPKSLASKVEANLEHAEVLFSTEELKQLVAICRPDASLAQKSHKMASEIHRLANIRIEQLADKCS